MRRGAPRVLVAALALALVFAGTALASENRPTLSELENEVTCPTCKTLLALSNAPVAERMRAFILERIDAGDTKSEIKSALVEEFGDRVLAAPPTSGANLLVWILPIAGAVVAIVLVALMLRRWSRARGSPPPAAVTGAGEAATLDPRLDSRLDEELRRFDG